MFLNPTAKPTPRRTPSPRVVLPAPPGRRIGSRGSSSGSGMGISAAPPDDLGDRNRAGDDLAGREHVARTERVAHAQVDAADAERVRELVHLRLVREAGLDGAEAAHGAAGRVVRVDARRPRAARSGTAYGPHANEAAFEVTAVELEAYAPPSSRIRACTETSLPSRFPRCSHPDPRRDGGGCGRRTTPRGCRRTSRAGSCAGRAWRRGSAWRGPRGRRTRRRRRRGGCARGSASGRGTAPPGRGRRAATGWRRRCRRRPRRRARPARTRGRGRPGPGCRARRCPRPTTSPSRVGVAVADDDRADDVRAADPRGSRGRASSARGGSPRVSGARLGIDDRLELLVLDPHLLGGAARLLGVLGGDDRDRLAEVADAVEGEHRLVGELEAVALLAGTSSCVSTAWTPGMPTARSCRSPG